MILLKRFITQGCGMNEITRTHATRRLPDLPPPSTPLMTSSCMQGSPSQFLDTYLGTLYRSCHFGRTSASEVVPLRRLAVYTLRAERQIQGPSKLDHSLSEIKSAEVVSKVWVCRNLLYGKYGDVLGTEHRRAEVAPMLLRMLILIQPQQLHVHHVSHCVARLWVKSSQ